MELLRSGGELALHFGHRFSPEEVVAEVQAAGLRVLWHEQSPQGRIVLVKDP